MLRRLLNIASIVCLVVCVALVGLWVRSYYWMDMLTGHFSQTNVIGVGSTQGRLCFGRDSDGSSDLYPWGFSTVPTNRPQDESIWFGFEASQNTSMTSLIIPYWFLALMSGSLAMIFRLKWPMRFTVRSLFVATTFLAVVLGMIAWLDRA